MKPLLTDVNTFATPLLIFIVDNLGMDAFEYEPETIEDFLKSHNPDIHRTLVDRANAALGLFSSDLFWQDPVTFGIVCRTFNRKRRPLSTEPDLEDIAWGMTEASLIINDPDDEQGKETYSHSVLSYAQYMLKLNGIYDKTQSMPAVEPTDFNSSFQDSEQLVSIQERSDDARAILDYKTFSKMSELLRQIKDNNLTLSAQASKELDALIKDTEVYSK
jgi:hypothetical protein